MTRGNDAGQHPGDRHARELYRHGDDGRHPVVVLGGDEGGEDGREEHRRRLPQVVGDGDGECDGARKLHLEGGEDAGEGLREPPQRLHDPVGVHRTQHDGELSREESLVRRQLVHVEPAVVVVVLFVVGCVGDLDSLDVGPQIPQALSDPLPPRHPESLRGGESDGVVATEEAEGEPVESGDGLLREGVPHCDGGRYGRHDDGGGGVDEGEEGGEEGAELHQEALGPGGDPLPLRQRVADLLHAGRLPLLGEGKPAVLRHRGPGADAA
mmetsp:Transcript_33227/g.83836  ORF Transcript_33227/g.83836 Transcript_33227/m.83836 type:complete len:268 (-) Transcript_33227:55-858(-)